jgi:hypothetical protein
VIYLWFKTVYLVAYLKIKGSGAVFLIFGEQAGKKIIIAQLIRFAVYHIGFLPRSNTAQQIPQMQKARDAIL